MSKTYKAIKIDAERNLISTVEITDYKDIQKEIADMLEGEVPQHIIKGRRPTQNNNEKQKLIQSIKRKLRNG